jgi:hypothetical protein
VRAGIVAVAGQAIPFSWFSAAPTGLGTARRRQRPSRHRSPSAKGVPSPLPWPAAVQSAGVGQDTPPRKLKLARAGLGAGWTCQAAGTGVIASGGGIISAQGPPGSVSTALTLNNSKVNNNTAGGDGGGIANDIPLPGPMPLLGGQLTLNHSQVTGNTASHGGGIFNNGGTVTLSATSVIGNNPDNCEPPGSIPGCAG